jgi:hypothetical protein
MPFKSDFALLDVKTGRAALARRIAKGEEIPVTIRGTIIGVWGNDDGTSIEFQMDVASVKERATR